MKTKYTSKVQLKLNEFDEEKVIEWKFHITEKPFSYDMIIGRDLMSEIGIKMDFTDSTMTWDNAVVSMKSIDATVQELYHVEDSPKVADATERMKRILDAKYELADINDIVNSCDHLNNQEKEPLRVLLERYKSLFDGNLGLWNDEQYDLELKPGMTPHHARAYPIPKAHEKTLCMEVQCLCKV